MAALFWFTIQQHLRLRKLWFVLLLLVSPCALALVVRHFDIVDHLEAAWKLYQMPMLHVYFMVVLPLVCMLHGSALISAEMDERTLVYLITRRMHRETVLLMRLAAAWLLFTALAEVAAVVFYLCAIAGLNIDQFNEAAGRAASDAWVPWHDLLCYMRAVPWATAAFLALFTLISLVFRRAMIVSLGYLIAVEMVVTNLPVRAQVYTVSHQLRQMLKISIPDLLEAFGSRHTRTLIAPFYPPEATGVTALLIVILTALALGCVAVRARELVHIKTSHD